MIAILAIVVGGSLVAMVPASVIGEMFGFKVGLFTWFILVHWGRWWLDKELR